MIKKHLLPVYVISICLVTSLIFNFFLNDKIYDLNKKIKEEQYFNEYLREQKFLLLKSNINAHLITSTLKTDFPPNNIDKYEHLIIFIPTEACWDCVEDLMRKMSILSLKYSIKNHVFCTRVNNRNINTLVSNEKLNTEIHVSELVNEAFEKFTPKQQIIIIVHNPLKEMYFSYAVMEDEDPIEFLTNNYFDAR